MGGSRSVLFREVQQLVCTWRLIKHIDLLYVDHAGVLLGGLYARLSKVKVVFRVMGCYGIRTSFKNVNFFKRVYQWSYKAPFSAIIATQDGSGVQECLDVACSRKSKTYILLNGVDMFHIDKEPSFHLPTNKTIVLFVGRLDYDKGCKEFFEALVQILLKNQNLYGLVVGDGPLRLFLEEKVIALNLHDSFHVISKVKHDEVLDIQNSSDIYISLNRAGNLSNANLEAMSVGQCMIIPKSQEETHIDLITDSLLSDKAVMRVSSVDNINEIAQAILTLHGNPDLRQSMSNNLKQESKKFLRSWDERIEEEIAILESLHQDD